MTNSEFKKTIAAYLFKNQDAVTPREVALHLGLDPSKSRHYDLLRIMTEASEIERIDGKYAIADYGITKYGLRAGIEKSSAVNATEKHEPAEIESKPYPFVTDSVVEDIKTTIGYGEGFETQVEVTITDLDAHLDDKDMVKAVLLNAVTEINSKLSKPRSITDAENKAQKLRELATHLNCENACLLNNIAEYIEGGA